MPINHTESVGNGWKFQKWIRDMVLFCIWKKNSEKMKLINSLKLKEQHFHSDIILLSASLHTINKN